MEKFRWIIVLLMSVFIGLMYSCAHDHEHEEGLDHAQAGTHETDDDHEHAEEQEAQGDEEHLEDAIGADTSEWERLIGLETAVVERMDLERVISVPGQIIPNQNQIAVVSPFIESSVNCVFVNVGDSVHEGEELVCLTSPEIGILRADYDKAKAELEIQKQNFERQSRLFEENIISKKAYQQAELDMRVAGVNFEYARKKLLAIGIADEEVENPPTGHSHAVGSTIHVHAPISGVITARNASIGQKVDPSDRLFEIINLENVWCEADIFEKDLSQIRIGQRMKVRISGYPEALFAGRIFYMGSTLAPDTKTIKILAEIDNRARMLKPGMFANTHIVVGMEVNVLAVLKEAVLKDEGLQIVFVKEPEGYHRHVVMTGIVSDPYIEILSGVEEGAVVVTKGNYQLKSKLKMSGIDPHAGHQH